MSTENPQEERFDPDALPVQTGQIICGAMIGGVLIFLGLVLMRNGGQPAGNPFMASMAAGFAAMAIAGYAVVPNLMAGAQMPHADPEAGRADRPSPNAVATKLYGIYQTKMIAGLALLEGAAFFNVIAYMLEGQVWTLGVVGGLLLLMVLSFPTRGRVAFWIETQLQSLGYDR